MRINNNIPALVANNQLQKTNSSLDRSLERLSSGLRINRAADDAAGMAISQKMKTQIAALNQSSRNASDGISVIQTAEGALAEVESMLQRMRELSVQAANGTNTDVDRKSIQQEINQLNAEIKRISTNTEFNTKTLLDGSMDRKVTSDNINVKLTSFTDGVMAGKYTVETATKAELISGAVGDYTATEVGTITINGQEVQVIVGDTMPVIVEKIKTVCDVLSIDLSSATGNLGEVGSNLIFQTREYGSKEKIIIESSSEDLTSALGLSSDMLGVESRGTDPVVKLEGEDTNFSVTSSNVEDKVIFTVKDINGFEMQIEILGGVVLDKDNPANITVFDAGPMTLHIGANQGQLIQVSIPEVSPETLGISLLSVETEAGAQDGIGLLDQAINQVSSIRSKLGAYQNRLDHAIMSLDVTSQNMTEALSRIEDVDMAEEMANYTQKNVLAQAGTSMLAQANERPQTILSLLQG